MSDGAFSWGNDSKKGISAGKEGKLPRHIERMNKGTAAPETKGSVMKNGKSMSDSGLPWGGEPAEKKKAYESGPPKNKGSVTGKLGQRTSAVGKLPHESDAAHVGHTMQIKSKASCAGMSMGKKRK